MRDFEDTRRENEEFFRDQTRMIEARLALLPRGQIKSKRKGSEVYYYLQYRKGSSVKTDYVGKNVPDSLDEMLRERARLEKELKRVREALRTMKAGGEGAADLVDPLVAILRKLTEEKAWDAGFEIIGSWCFLLYQRHLPMEKYPLKTEDLDILIPRPFRGRVFDLAEFLQRLGFVQHFNPNGSTFFSGNGMKVEFLAKEGRPRMKGARESELFGVTPQELRFLEILFEEPLVLKVARGVRVKVPAPAAFLIHKLIISTRPGRSKKRDKDIRQAIYVAQYALLNEAEADRLKRLWHGLPQKWKARVDRALEVAKDVVPLQGGVITRLRKYVLI
jgi:hypothetical protein